MVLYERVLGEDTGYMLSHVLGAVLLGMMGLNHLLNPGQSLVANLLQGVTGGATSTVAMVAGVLVITLAIDLGIDGLGME